MAGRIGSFDHSGTLNIMDSSTGQTDVPCLEGEGLVCTCCTMFCSRGF